MIRATFLISVQVNDSTPITVLLLAKVLNAARHPCDYQHKQLVVAHWRIVKNGADVWARDFTANKVGCSA
jgi:hypothetical protein